MEALRGNEVRWHHEGGASMMGLVVLLQYQWAHSFCHVRTQYEGSPLQTRKRAQNLSIPASWSQTSTLQNFEKINFYCLSHPVYGTLLRQPEKTMTPMNGLFFIFLWSGFEATLLAKRTRWTPCTRARCRCQLYADASSKWVKDPLETVKKMLGPWWWEDHSQRQRPSLIFNCSISLPIRRWYADAKSQRQEGQQGEQWVEEAPASNPIWDFWTFQPISRADKEDEMCSLRLLTLPHKYHPEAQGIHEWKRRSAGHLLLSCLV